MSWASWWTWSLQIRRKWRSDRAAPAQERSVLCAWSCPISTRSACGIQTRSWSDQTAFFAGVMPHTLTSESLCCKRRRQPLQRLCWIRTILCHSSSSRSNPRNQLYFGQCWLWRCSRPSCDSCHPWHGLIHQLSLSVLDRSPRCPLWSCLQTGRNRCWPSLPNLGSLRSTASWCASLWCESRSARSWVNSQSCRIQSPPLSQRFSYAWRRSMHKTGRSSLSADP